MRVCIISIVLFLSLSLSLNFFHCACASCVGKVVGKAKFLSQKSDNVMFAPGYR